MRITAARLDCGELVLTVDDARAFVHGFREGEYEIKRVRAPRSLTANAYAWVLIGKLAQATGQKMSDVYRSAIRDIGGVWDVVQVRNRALKHFCDIWNGKGLGWQTEILNTGDDFSHVAVFYGSSVYDRKQMAALIDSLVQDCRALEIETLPPEKLEALLK